MLMEEHRCRMFESRVLRRTSVSERRKIVEECNCFQNRNIMSRMQKVLTMVYKTKIFWV
jgi:hypothetical protein